MGEKITVSRSELKEIVREIIKEERNTSHKAELRTPDLRETIRRVTAEYLERHKE